MSKIVETVRQHGIIAVLDLPFAERILEWAMAVAKGGVRMLAIPVTVPNVAEITDELTDQVDLVVGVTGVVNPEQVAIAVAAGAEFMLTPVSDPDVIFPAASRGISVIAGAFTPTEVVVANRAGADLVTLHPVGALGGHRYFESIARTFPSVPLLASGGIDVENAPSFLEAGALGVLVDRGVFPDTNDPAALEVITARALALTEVCSEVLGAPKRISMSEMILFEPLSDLLEPEGME